jgi:hypothetical protein
VSGKAGFERMFRAGTLTNGSESRVAASVRNEGKVEASTSRSDIIELRIRRVHNRFSSRFEVRSV